MTRTKMSAATDILLTQMKRIEDLAKDERTDENKLLLREAIIASKTLNGAASSIIKEAATTLAIEKYANSNRTDLDTIINRLGVGYDEK